MELSFTFDIKVFGLILAAMAVGTYVFFSVKNLFSNKKSSVTYFATMLAASGLVFAGCCIARLHSKLEFDSCVTDHLVAAYNAKTLSESKLQFDRAVKYIKDNNLTEGSTALLYPSPQYNIGDWYAKVQTTETAINSLMSFNEDDSWKKTIMALKDKVKTSDCQELICLLDNASANIDRALDSKAALTKLSLKDKDWKPWQQLLENNDLIKVRMTPTGKETVLACPDGISCPNSVMYLVWFLSSVFNTLFSGVGFVTKAIKFS